MLQIFQNRINYPCDSFSEAGSHIDSTVYSFIENLTNPMPELRVVLPRKSCRRRKGHAALPNGRCLVCKSLDTTLLFKCIVQKYIYPSVSKGHTGSFRVSAIHRTLTWTTGSLMCVRIILKPAYTHGGGWAHRQRVSTTFLTRGKKSHIFLTGVRTRVIDVIEPEARRSTHWAHPGRTTTGSCRGHWYHKLLMVR